MKLKIRNRPPVFLLVTSIIVFDQITKIFANSFFEVSCNKGGAFGISGNFHVVSSIVLILVLWIIIREKNWLNLAGLALVFGGGLSNLIDRLVVGCVRDFISLGFFPSFNLADTAITIGAFLIFLNLFLPKRELDGI